MDTCSPNPDDSYTYSYQKLEPLGFCLYLKGLDGISTIFKPILYTKESEGDDVAAMFVSKIAWLTNEIYNNSYCRPSPLRLTEIEQE